MKLRHIKRRHDARTARQRYVLTLAAFMALEESGWAGEDHYFHDDDGEVHDRTCRFCDGTGGDRWNDGITPCEHCDGEGYEWWK